jgi:HK97 family phage prohead protease
MSKTTEVRSLECEVRAIREDGKPTRLVGYAAKFDELSQDLGGFREKIAPGAFDETLKANPDIRALVDHDYTRILGRTKAGTLKLNADATGLAVDISLPDTSYARDMIESIARGDIAGMSFGFWVEGEEWDNTDKANPIRTLTKIDLREVTVTSIPAYLSTELSLRVDPDAAGRANAKAEAAAKAAADIAAQHQANRLYLQLID